MKYITRKEAAELCNVDRMTITNWADKGLIRTRKHPKIDKGLRRFCLEDIEAFIAQSAEVVELEQSVEEYKQSLFRERERYDDMVRMLKAEMRETKSNWYAFTGRMLPAATETLKTIYNMEYYYSPVTMREINILQDYFSFMPLDELRDKYGLSKERVRQLIERATRRLAKASEKLPHTIMDLHNQNVELAMKNRELEAEVKRLANLLPVEVTNLDEDMRCKLATKLGDLPLSVRAHNSVKAWDIDTLGDLASVTALEMARTRNLGRKTLNELDCLLDKYGLEFGMDLQTYGYHDKIRDWRTSHGYRN